MKVTDLTRQKKDSERINVFMDGAFYCALSSEAVVLHGVTVGSVWAEEALAKIREEDDRRNAFRYGLTLVSRRRYTEKEIFDATVKRGYSERAAAEAVERLKEYRYLDDGDYATAFVSAHKGGKGRLRISMDLRRKGVDGSEVEEALEGFSSEEEEERAEVVAERYARGKAHGQKLAQGVYRHLAYRGYPSDIASDIARRYMNDEE